MYYILSTGHSSTLASFAAVVRDVTQRSPEMQAAVPFGVALRDIPKDGSEGDYYLLAVILEYFLCLLAH